MIDRLTNAGLTYEYAAYNELPPDGMKFEDLAWGDQHWFTSPIRTSYDRMEIEKFVRECNIENDVARRAMREEGETLHIDKIVDGAHVKVVARRRLVIKLPFEDYK